MAEIELPIHESAEAEDKGFARRVALTTAIYALALAITSLGGSNAMKEMILAQQEASDQWAFYQAKSIRQHHYQAEAMRLEAELTERGASMPAEARTKFDALRSKFSSEARRYETEKEEIRKHAEHLQHERDRYRSKDPNFDVAEALLQIAIVVSSAAILSTSHLLYRISMVFAAVGAFLCLNGYLLFVRLF